MMSKSTALSPRHWMNALRLTVADSGVVQAADEWECDEPTLRDSVCLLYVSEGTGVLLCGDDPLLVRPECVYFVPSGQWRVRSEENAPLSFLFFRVCAPEPSMQALLNACPRPMASCVSPQTIRQALSLYGNDGVYSSLLLYSLVFNNLALFLADAQPPETVCSPMTMQAAGLVQKLLSSKLTVNRLAETMAVSPVTLAKRFRAETGTSLGAYIDRMVFQHARQLLIYSETSIGEIADQLGFCDQFYFSRFFRRIQGETPTQFRRRTRGETGDATP